MFYYLSYSQLLLIHDLALSKGGGGAPGIRDDGLLRQLADKPRMSLYGQDQFKTVFDKAGCYFQGIATRHPFIDGNKRTGFLSGISFLILNGYQSTIVYDKTVENYAVKLADEKIPVSDVAEWFKRHSKKDK